jgi:hypothetical protein
MMGDAYLIDVKKGYRDNEDVLRYKENLGMAYENIRRGDTEGRICLLNSIDEALETWFNAGEDKGYGPSNGLRVIVPTPQEIVIDESLYERVLSPLGMTGIERGLIEMIIKSTCYQVFIVGFNRGLAGGATGVRRMLAAPNN